MTRQTGYHSLLTLRLAKNLFARIPVLLIVILGIVSCIRFPGSGNRSGLSGGASDATNGGQNGSVSPEEAARLAEMEQAAKEALDEIQIERDAARRRVMIDAFLKTWPESRHVAACIGAELSTLVELDGNEAAAGRAALRESEHPDDPRILRIVAECLLEVKLRNEHALELARNALRMDLAGEGPFREAGEPDRALRERETRYRLTLIRALAATLAWSEALSACDEALQRVPDNDAGLTCALHRYRGDVLVESGRPEDAKQAYLKSVILGDPRNRHTADALLKLTALCGFGAAPDGIGAVPVAMDKYRGLTGYAGPVFDDVTAECGLTGLTQGRVAWGDADGDGWPDILLDGSVLLRNEAGATFSEVSEEAGLAPDGRGGLFVDTDNDGDLDIFVLSHDKASVQHETDSDNPDTGVAESGDRLYLNDDAGRFVEASGGPLADDYPSEGAAWCDLDGDGLADLVVANYEQEIEQTGGERGVGSPDRVYRNLGDNRFEDVSAGFMPPSGKHLCGRGVNCADFNNDGRQDIFVSNYRLQRNFLWVDHRVSEGRVSEGRVSEGGAETWNLLFVDEALERGVAGTDVDGWWGHTIGSVWGDCDNDGDLDLFSANLAHPRYIDFSDISQLLINSGPPDYRFTDRIAGSGITYDETHSNPAWADVDNDGDLDLYITSIYENERSYLYLNDGTGLKYTENGFLSGTRVTNGWGCAFADFDKDGDLDLLVGSGSGVRLFRNRGNANHWLRVEVSGIAGTPLGARVTVTQGDRVQIREIQAGSGTTSQDEGIAHFGFGRDGSPIKVQIRMSTGETSERQNVMPDGTIRL